MNKDQILESLSPMYNITSTVNEDGDTEILKDDIKFAIIKDDDVYFLDENNNFKMLDKTKIDHVDDVLKIATIAFWAAKSLEKEKKPIKEKLKMNNEQ